MIFGKNLLLRLAEGFGVRGLNGCQWFAESCSCLYVCAYMREVGWAEAPEWAFAAIPKCTQPQYVHIILYVFKYFLQKKKKKKKKIDKLQPCR